jgi:hypothetical protein
MGIIEKELRYIVFEMQRYFSKRYGKYVTIEAGFRTDGATGAFDIRGKVKVYDTWGKEFIFVSLSWIVHDKLCDTGIFCDGTKCTNKQASTILSDILRSEGRWARAIYWWPMTYFFGGGKCRDN